ncbi:hypothetical protein ACFL6G_08530 [candidate division KSB1 bacterium]
MTFKSNLSGIILPVIIVFCTSLSAGAQERFDSDLLKNFQFRNLGPFRAGAWITDIAVPESPEKAHLYTFYAATRNGGIWKTINNGTTFEPVFDDQEVLSIGDIAVAPSDPDIVWAGTGENSNARSTYWGDGVYKSKDAGKTWQNMGLQDSHHIARIIIHPSDPDIVYVAALGHLYSFNEERGVFKTENGGRTWEKVLYINEKIAAVDLVINRKDPRILYAAMYEKYRYPWHFEEGGPKSGIYKTADAGRTWNSLDGGLPAGKIGRIGIDIYRKDPEILYAVVENANPREPTEEEIRQDRRRGVEPQQRIIGGEVYRTDNGGRTWEKMNSGEDNIGGKAAYSFNQIRIDPNNDKKVFVTGVTLANTDDGGRTWNDADWPPRKMFSTCFGDVRTFWIDPENSDRMIMGSDGGIHLTYDAGKTCDFLDNLPLGEIYALGVDMNFPYNIYAGLQDHESWKGPSNGWSGSIGIEDWVTVGIWDGMYNQVDPDDSRWLYNTAQFGAHGRVDQKLGTRTNIVPVRENGLDPYRFNWCTPIIISPHNSRVIYTGTQMLLRSMDRGDNWQEISPDLTDNDPVKIAGRGHIQYCTITTISESPITPGVIWIGTDDGKVWITENYGADWTDCTRKIAALGGPENYWVSRVFASNYNTGTAYVTKTGYRRDDFRTFIFKTRDFGETWESVSGNLTDKPVNVIFEDKKNPDLLFAGTDRGLYVTIDGGQKWVNMNNNMPLVPIHDLVIHPRENDLVIGTYGRGIFVTDISPLQEMNETVLDEDFYLFDIEHKMKRTRNAMGNYQLYGDRHIRTPNEPNSVVINYYLKNPAVGDVKVTIEDPYGILVREIKGTGDSGLNTVNWPINRAESGDYVVKIEAEGRIIEKRTKIYEMNQK